MREIFRDLNVESTFRAVNHARIRLTTSGFPYLKALAADDVVQPNAVKFIRGARRALGRIEARGN